MSLNWNISKVANHDSVCLTPPDEEGNTHLTSLTHSLIWATLAVDLGEIKAKNLDEWMFRLAAISLAYNDPAWAAITREQIEAHIGLNTNATNSTRAKFLKKMLTVLTREANDLVRRNRTPVNA